MGSLWAVMFEVPLAKPLPSLANWRGHWAAKAQIVKRQREVTALAMVTRGGEWLRQWRIMRANERLGVGVLLTRIAPRELDSDNLQGAFKGIRDEVAKHIGIDDRSPRYAWEYHQQRGKPAIRVCLEVLRPEVPRGA